jgi:hypothetical protein
MATFTATEINALKHLHGAYNVVRSRAVAAANGFTVSDVFLMTRIPNGATVIDWRLIGGTAGVTSATWSVGLQGSVVDAISGNSLTADSLHAGVSLTAGGIGGSHYITNTAATADATITDSVVTVTVTVSGNRPSPVVPFKVSLSDGAQPKHVWLQISPSGSLTGSTSLQMVVSYLLGE